MSDSNLTNQLRELRTVHRAPALWREQTRERLLSISAQEPGRAFSANETFRLAWAHVRLAFAPLPLVPVALAVLTLLFGSVPFGRATQASLPGSVLYPLKRTVERVQLSFRATPESQGLYHLVLAARRLDEVTTLSPSTGPTRASLLRDYNVDLDFAQASLQAAQPGAQVALQYDEAVEQLAQHLAAIRPDSSLALNYAVATSLTDRLSSEAVAFLVSSHQTGTNGVLPAAVASRLESQISKVQAKLDGVDSRLKLFPESKPAPRVVLEARQAIVPVNEATREAKRSLTEARNLVQRKEFTLALQKVQESEDITTKSAAAVDKAEQPVVPGKVEGAADQPSSSLEPTVPVSSGTTTSPTTGADSSTPDQTGSAPAPLPTSPTQVSPK